MANYSREEAEKQGKKEENIVADLLVGVASLAVGGVVYKSKKNKEKEKTNQQIQKINEEINDYKSKFFGSTLYADEIRALEKERENLRKELKNL